jgi:hypothetical protein
MKTKAIIILLIFISISCIKKEKNPKDISKHDRKVESGLNISYCNDYFYCTDSLNIQLSVLKKTKQIGFNICIDAINDTFNLNTNANLILIEDENGKTYVPEGAFILDSSSNEEYLCDSTYEYISDKICFSFGFEKSANKRISLVIYNSKIDFIKDNEFTLHKKQE